MISYYYTEIKPEEADDLINDYYECLKMMFDAKVTIYLRVSGFDFEQNALNYDSLPLNRGHLSA